MKRSLLSKNSSRESKKGVAMFIFLKNSMLSIDTLLSSLAHRTGNKKLFMRSRATRRAFAVYTLFNSYHCAIQATRSQLHLQSRSFPESSSAAKCFRSASTAFAFPTPPICLPGIRGALKSTLSTKLRILAMTYTPQSCLLS
jgi:hypothetical protein